MKRKGKLRQKKTLRARIFFLQICLPLALFSAKLSARIVVNHDCLNMSVKLLNYQQPIPQNLYA